MAKTVLGQAWKFCKKEAVLAIACLLAVISCFFVPPSAAYIGYVDWNTLALLFRLMAVVKAAQQAGVFLWVGNALLRRASTARRMLLVLVFLPFFLSMLITNDVALITFVPLGIAVLRLADQEQLVVPMAVLQTIAANLGSALTPMGNPQNLYLYAKSGMQFGELFALMAPYGLCTAVCLVVLAWPSGAKPVRAARVNAQLGRPWQLLCCGAGFALCLLGIFKWLAPLAIALVVAVFLLFADRKLLAGLDYSLLFTFIAFFVLIGNIGQIGWFRQFIAAALEGHVTLVAVLASQVMSNVPAALLLSGFTSQWPQLIVGCNLGGLGTLIASMASLISYKVIAKEYPHLCGRYLGWFTLCNVGLLAVLLTLNRLV